MDKNNLKTKNFKDNTPLVAYFYDDNESLYKDTYGALYEWSVASSGKLCPTGWHVPSHIERTILGAHF